MTSRTTGIGMNERERVLVEALEKLCDAIADTELHGDGAHDESCFVCKAHQRARAALDAIYPVDPWQPIETKPDGNALLYYPKEYRRGQLYHSDWIVVGDGRSHRKPTHYIPLPAPPAGDAKQGGTEEKS
jgi:hypothetical protein